MKDNQVTLIGAAILGTLVSIVVSLVVVLFLGFLVAAFWNVSVARIFSLPEIDSIQGACLFLLTNLLIATPMVSLGRR